MTKILTRIVIIILIFASVSFSQKSVTDSLKNVLQNRPDDTAKVNILNLLGNLTVDQDAEESFNYIEAAEKLSLKLKYKKGYLDASYLKAEYYYNISQYENTVKQAIKSAELGEAEKDTTTIILSRNLLASVYARMNNLVKAIDIYEDLKKIIEKSGDLRDKLMLYNNMGNLYGFMGNFEKAESSYVKCYNYAVGLPVHRGGAANNLSFLNVLKNNGSEAIKWANIAIAIAESINHSGLLMECLTNLGNGYYKSGDFDRAIQIGLRVIDLAKEQKALLQEQNAYGNMYLYNEGKGNYKTALDYYKKYTDLKDTIFNNNMMKQITELEAKYETEKKSRELAQKDEELRLASIKFNWTIAILLIVAVSLFTISLFFINIKKAYNELVKKNYELSKIKTDLFESNINVEKEQRKVSNLVELHIEDPEKYHSSSLSDEKKEDIYYRIRRLLEEEKVFMQKGITIEKFAMILEINSKYISQVINEKYEGGFSAVINDYRIRESIKLLSDEKYSSYSIEGIADTVGFNSKSVFNTTFKRLTGLTPSYYRNNIKIAKGA